MLMALKVKRMYVLAPICLLLLFFAAFASKTAADEILITADQWCPYNCEPETNMPGFMVEMTQLILGESGHRVTYMNVPWNRAQKMAHLGKYNAIIAGTPENTKEFEPPFVFPKNEQGRMKNCFFVMKNNSWRYSGVESLVDQQIGIVQGYGYPSIQSYIDKYKSTSLVQAMAGDNPVAANIKKLVKGRLTAVLEDEAVFKYTASKMGWGDRFTIAGDDGTDPEANNLYIAFTPLKTNPKSDEYATVLSRGMEKIRQNGKLNEIMAKYGLSDWKQDEKSE